MYVKYWALHKHHEKSWRVSPLRSVMPTSHALHWASMGTSKANKTRRAHPIHSIKQLLFLNVTLVLSQFFRVTRHRYTASSRLWLLQISPKLKAFWAKVNCNLSCKQTWAGFYTWRVFPGEQGKVRWQEGSLKEQTAGQNETQQNKGSSRCTARAIGVPFPAWVPECHMV